MDRMRDRMRKKIPKPTPNPKPQPKPKPKPPQRPIPDIPRPKPRIPEIPNRRNPQIPVPPSDVEGPIVVGPGRPLPQIPPLPDRTIPTPVPEQIGDMVIRYLPDGTPITASQGGVVGPRRGLDYDSLMAQQTYNNIMQQQMANAMAQGVNLGTQPQLAQPIAARLPQASQPAQPNQQAMQNYQNLVGQGIANMQAMGRITPPGQLPNQPQRKPSTSSFQTPRPFG